MSRVTGSCSRTGCHSFPEAPVLVTVAVPVPVERGVTASLEYDAPVFRSAASPTQHRAVVAPATQAVGQPSAPTWPRGLTQGDGRANPPGRPPELVLHCARRQFIVFVGFSSGGKGLARRALADHAALPEQTPVPERWPQRPAIIDAQNLNTILRSCFALVHAAPQLSFDPQNLDEMPRE